MEGVVFVGQVKVSLEKQASILQSLQDSVVRQMEEQVRTLDKRTKVLEENLRFNHSSLNSSINLILLEVTQAQEYLNTTASKEIKNVCGRRICYVQNLNFLLFMKLNVTLFHDTLRCGALQLKQPASLFRKMLRNVI
jgi:hypothetical protein